MHTGLRQVLRSFNVEEELVKVIQALYENSSSAVLLNSQLGEFFKSTVGVRQGCLLSPILFNLFLEKIMQEILHDHHMRKIKIYLTRPGKMYLTSSNIQEKSSLKK